MVVKIGQSACVIQKKEMAETEELKQMVLSFRRAELVDLLGFVGMNKVGVKATLLQRAISLINSSRGCSVPVQIKIRDLYRQIHNPFDNESTRSRTLMRSQVQVQDPRGSRRYATGKTVTPAIVPGSINGQSMSSAVDYSKRAAADSLSQSSSQIPVHPDVTFKRLPFFDTIGELLKPTSLAPKGPSRYQETYFVFHLTPQQAQDIAMSRDFRPTAKCEYTVQVQLRFCFLETSCEQDDNFPPSICVRVNSKMAQLPNPIPTTKPGVEPKRPGRPVDITSLCRISPTMPNHVEISWASEYGRGFCCCINLVRRLSSDTLLTRLKQFGNRHADHTRALIKEKLHHDADSEIATTSLRITLTCPLGKMRMQIPCRAGTCSHLQCFDATTFLMMNEKKPTWNCPVCDKPAPFHKLVIDGLFVEILKQVSDVDEIQFIEDGTWSPVRNAKETHHIHNSPAVSRNSSKLTPENTVNLCGDADDVSMSPTKKPKMEVIDLTLSDSEDEQDDNPRPQSTQDISSGSVVESLSPTSPVRSPSPMITSAKTGSTPRSPTTGIFTSSAASVSSNNLPPLPPLLSYKNANSHSHSLRNSIESVVLDLAKPNRAANKTSLESYNPSTSSSSAAYSAAVANSSESVGSIPSWLNALSDQTQGQKRPLPAHANSQPHKRQMLEKVSDSPSSSNSNMSPLVDQRSRVPDPHAIRRNVVWTASNPFPQRDLDQLCSILDSDRERNNEEIASVMPFANDYRLSSGSESNSRNVFSVSPSDIISLD